MKLQLLNLTPEPTELWQKKFPQYEIIHTNTQHLFTFSATPAIADLQIRAETLAHYAYARRIKSVLISEPYFMVKYLENVLLKQRLRPLYPFPFREERWTLIGLEYAEFPHFAGEK